MANVARKYKFMKVAVSAYSMQNSGSWYYQCNIL
jgi:hypothetical protein